MTERMDITSADVATLTEWFYAGQRVKFTDHAATAGFAGYGTVKKVAQKNYQVTQDSKPDGWVNVPIASAKRWIEKADADAPAPPERPQVTQPDVGAIVRVDSTRVKKIPTDTLYVVFGSARGGEFSKVVRVGGDPSGRYWSVPNSALTTVNVKVTETE